MLSFFPPGVLDEILNLIESVSEGFPSYSNLYKCKRMDMSRLSKIRCEVVRNWYRNKVVCGLVHHE